MPRPPGTPDKLTTEVQEAICAALEIAVPAKYAALGNGISEDAFQEWCEKGKAGLQPYAEFYRLVTRARAKAVENLAKRALTGEKGSQAATWMLERRFREDYGPIQKVQLGGDPDGVPLETIDKTLDKLGVDDLRKLANGQD